MQQTNVRPHDRTQPHRRTGLPRTGGPPPRRPCTPASPAPVRRPLPCRAGDPDLWFAETPAQLETAKALCGDCPVRSACLAGAIDRGEPWGVWGGEIFERGAVVPRKRPRGRPRKEDLARDAVLQVEVEQRLAANGLTESRSAVRLAA